MSVSVFWGTSHCSWLLREGVADERGVARGGASYEGVARREKPVVGVARGEARGGSGKTRSQ